MRNNKPQKPPRHRYLKLTIVAKIPDKIRVGDSFVVCRKFDFQTFFAKAESMGFKIVVDYLGYGRNWVHVVDRHGTGNKNVTKWG